MSERLKIKTDNEYLKLDSKKFYSIDLVRTPRLGRILAYWSAGIFAVIFLSLFLPWTQNIRSRGELTTFNPEDRPQTIHSIIAGRIEKWHVLEGQFVKKGDKIVSLSEVKEKYFDPQLLQRVDEQIQSKEGSLKSTQDKAEALRKQIDALRAGLQVSLSKARNKVRQAQLKIQSDSMDLVAMRAENEIAKTQYERQEKLYQQGLKSLTELEQRKLKMQETAAKLLSTENKYYASRNELLNTRLELNSLEAEYLDKISKAESELNSTLSYFYNTEAEVSKMINEFANVQIRSGFYQIRAPQDGYVVRALKEGIGETIKEGEPITTIMPANPEMAVELYVKPMDIPLLSKGRKVRLQFDGWPAMVFSGWPNVSFGTFGGIVAVIDNIDSQGKYRILVIPDPDYEAWPGPIRVGSGVYGWIMLKDVPIWYEIWRQINGFPADYLGEEQAPQKEAKTGQSAKKPAKDDKQEE